MSLVNIEKLRMIIKTQEEFDAKVVEDSFIHFGDVVFNCDIHIKGCIKVFGSITSKDNIYATNIQADNITACLVEVYKLKCNGVLQIKDIKITSDLYNIGVFHAYKITCQDIHAKSIYANYLHASNVYCTDTLEVKHLQFYKTCIAENNLVFDTIDILHPDGVYLCVSKNKTNVCEKFHLK